MQDIWEEKPERVSIHTKMNLMQGKRVVITGPTSGVGKEAALGLAYLGAEVILACRDVQKGNQVVKEITRKTNSSKLEVIQVDMSSQESIHEFALTFRHKYRRLDVLINNAAINRGMLPKADSTDGIELTFATNVLGYFLLTQEFLGLMKQSAPARLINVASAFAGDLDMDDLEFKERKFESFKAYSQSKACDRLLTWATARRLGENNRNGVTVNAVTPSLIPTTGLFRHAGPERVKELTRYAGGRTAAEGADSLIWLASDPKLEGVTNKFFQDREEQHCELRSEEDEEKLWKICEEYVKKK
jgi:NAD(P)-dependent dehydrogenase (short-subunit alcohol dehydrogenase family)